jgi:hypothetical protein
MQGLMALVDAVLEQHLKPSEWSHLNGVWRSRRLHPTVSERIDAEQARREQGNWVPACGGTETPFTSRSGLRLLYCWQPATGRHAYINCDTDIALTDDEAREALTW